MGLVLKSVPEETLDDEVEAMANRLASVPKNQLAMQKMVINQAWTGGSDWTFWYSAACKTS